MPKAVRPLITAIAALAALALLFAALAGGWSAATPSGSFAASAQERWASQDPTSVEDDDSDGDDDGVEQSMLAPPRADDDDQDDAESDADGDGHALEPSTDRRFPPRVVTMSSSMTRWGLRPSGEHRDAADRPPRS